jgi:quercetin dioxygenase-like cupin family protein
MKKSTSEIIEELKKEGYTNIFVWSDSAGTEYDWHTHPYEEIRVMLKGEMIINTKDATYHLKEGDVLKVPAGEVHDAKVLSDCEYVCGSKI